MRENQMERLICELINQNRFPSERGTLQGTCPTVGGTLVMQSTDQAKASFSTQTSTGCRVPVAIIFESKLQSFVS